MSHALHPRAALLAVTMLACPADPITADDPTTSDPTTGTATTDTPTTGDPFDGVTLIKEIEHRPIDAAPSVVPADPQQDVPLVIVVGDETFAASTYDGAGARRFPDVPNSEFTIRSESPPDPGLPGTGPFVELLHTDLRTLDYGLTFAGRADVAAADIPGTALTLDVAGLQPLQAGDRFEVYSANADALARLQPGDVPGDPEPGATSLSAWTVAWDETTVLSGRGGVPVLDPARSDDPRIAHLVSAPLIADPSPAELAGDAWAYALTTRLVASATLDLPAMVAGSATAATGTFIAAPAELADLDLRLTALQAELASLGPELAIFTCDITIVREPGVAVPIVGMTPTLAGLSVTAVDVPVDPTCYPDEQGMCDPMACVDGCNGDTARLVPGDRALELAWADPYAGDGAVTLAVGCSAFAAKTHPLAGTNEFLLAGIDLARPLADDGPVTPVIGAPVALRVGGQAATHDVVVSGVGTTPTLEYDPPLLGAPDYYEITVRTLEDVVDDQQNVLSRRRAIARLRTVSTSVQLPDGLLEQGSHYYFQVRAVVGTTLAALGRATSHTRGSASAATGLVTP